MNSWKFLVLIINILSFLNFLTCDQNVSENLQVKNPTSVIARKSEQACEKFKKIPNNLSPNDLNEHHAKMGEFPHMAALG